MATVTCNVRFDLVEYVFTMYSREFMKSRYWKLLGASGNVSAAALQRIIGGVNLALQKIRKCELVHL